MHGRAHSREFKLEVVRQVACGEKRPAQVCREHGLAESLLLRWWRDYAARGEVAFSPPGEADPGALERFCGRLALENAVLIKAVASARPRSAAP